MLVSRHLGDEWDQFNNFYFHINLKSFVSFFLLLFPMIFLLHSHFFSIFFFVSPVVDEDDEDIDNIHDEIFLNTSVFSLEKIYLLLAKNSCIIITMTLKNDVIAQVFVAFSWVNKNKCVFYGCLKTHSFYSNQSMTGSRLWKTSRPFFTTSLHIKWMGRDRANIAENFYYKKIGEIKDEKKSSVSIFNIL